MRDKQFINKQFKVMGFFLSSIREDLGTLEDQLHLHSYPLQRVREYHGIFKSVCDNFVIKNSQFQQIFGIEENINFWNSDTVNALQLFCGLAYYAKECSFRSKVRFLFGLFDFNEIKSISIVDLEYMILSVCNFTYKVLGKVNTKADQLRLAEWLLKYLDPHKRITITRLYRMCGQADQLFDFLAIAGATRDEFLTVQSLIQEPGVQFSQQKQEVRGERDIEIQTKLSWFSSFYSKLAKPKYKKESVTNTHLNWVYGIQIDKIKTPFQALAGPIAIYAVSNKMIVFNEQTKRQKIYAAHTRPITCFCIKAKDCIAASAEGDRRPHIYIWNFDQLETVNIIRLDHTHRISHMTFAQYDPVLAVAAERSTSPFLLFETVSWTLKTSFSHSQPIHHLAPFATNIPNNQVASYLQGFFVICGPHQLSIMDQVGIQYQTTYESEVTALAVSYINSSFPYLRYFHGQNLKLFIVTGHASGSVTVWQVGQDSVFQGIERDKFQALRMDEAIVQLKMTQQSFFVVTNQQIRVYDLTVLIYKESKVESEPRCIKLYEYPDLKLVNYTIRNISVTSSQICVLTTDGDFVVVGDRQAKWKNNGFVEEQSLRRVNTIVKFVSQMRAMCFLERELHNVLLVVSGGRRILQIDPDTHQVTLILDIGFDDFITVIDSTVGEEGGGLTVCGCRSGKLILRNDWEENCKVVDCGAQICALKVSPEGNTLLVATMNTLLFFHLGSSLSSPRKLTFENESPISLCFLDNSKFVAITTTAKNVYLLQLPSLKHRSVFRDVDTFAASRLEIAFPLPLQKTGIPSQCMIGGDMKFYLISLDDGSILFFPSMSSLQKNNFILLQGHRCSIVNLAVSEDQNTFYTLGQKDQMLLQWRVTELKPLFPLDNKGKQTDKITNSRVPLIKCDWQNVFKKMKRNSEAPVQNADYSLSTFFFRGTKEKKLNRRLRVQHMSNSNMEAEEAALSKRHSNLALATKIVHGLQTDKSNQVFYRNQNVEDSTILYTASRFLIETSPNENNQEILECHSKTIGFVSIDNQGEVIWAESGRYPWIWKNGQRCIKTKHSMGLIHFTLYNDLILSYGLSEKAYTINLHNYRTQKLLGQRTTDKQIIAFLMLSEREFISLAEVRWWKDMVQSQIVGMATSGVVLHNGKDVCLGGISGELSILCQNGMVEVAKQAHNKEITVIKTNIREEHKELVTASLDETIKLWNQYFQLLLVIDLNFQDEFSLLHQMQNEPAKSPMVYVCSLDCKANRVVATLAHGQIWQFLITSLFQKISQGLDIVSEVSLQSQNSEVDLTKNKLLASDKKHLVYKVENYKIMDAHCSGMAPSERYLVFDVHSKYPIMVTAGNDGRLILKDYERNIVLGNYLCEDRKQVKSLRFSPQGRMLVVGLTGGVIVTFYLILLFDSKDEISHLSLKYFQTFKPDRNPTESICIGFNQTGEYFCVSFWQQSKIKSSTEVRGGNFIKVFRMKSQKNSNIEEAFYEEREIIELREEEKFNSGLSKCILRMHWQIIQEKQYIIMYSEYLNPQTRYRLSHKGKYEVYCLEEKSYLSDQFSIDWISNSFPNLLHTLIVNPKGETLNEQYLLTAVHEHKGTLFCGGIDGRLHLVKSQALVSEQSVKDYKEEEMCLSRVYNSHSSFITKVLVMQSQNTGKMYVFTSAYGDETVVQLQILQEKSEYFLEHQPYPRQISDSFLHGECPLREHFYLMLNNRQPLREELTAVLEDVQKCVTSSLSLSPVRLFGRRASDRRYNMAFFQSSALYILGPNIIIQSLKSLKSQKVMKADPSPLSHCPQISTFHYQGRWLGVVTQEEHSSLFVWDIRSQSCLSSMHLECSIVFMLRFSGDNYAILYGLNDRYELVVQVVDWKARKQIGRARLAHSGNIAIRDICTYAGKANGLQFITCGHLHLCYWQLRGDSLVYKSFNTLKEAKYFCVRSLNNCIITGCEEGNLYLWVDFQMVHFLNGAHKAAVRCIEVDYGNDIFISGGKDGLILFLKIQDNKIDIFSRADLSQLETDPTQLDLSEENSWKVELQIQSIAISNQQFSSEMEKMLVGTRSGAIYEIKFNDQSQNTQVNLLYEGHDHQAIAGATFSAFEPNCFFTLSNAGIIEKWNLTTLTRQFSFQLGRKALKIESCGNYLLVCCRNEVMAYRVEQEGLSREQDFCIDTRRAGESEGDQSKESEIIKMCLSHNRMNLAVCIKICSKQPIYQISLYEFGRSKDPYHTISNLKHELDYIDFSIDDKYFLFKDRYEEIAMINLDSDKDYRRINTIFVEMGIEWQEEGLRISPNGQKIYYSYSCENKITAITRLGKDKIVVGDEMGTIRLFDYPCPDDRLGELHLHCYTNHMNDVQIIKVHPALTHVITTALLDRSFILWRVNPSSHNE